MAVEAMVRRLTDHAFQRARDTDSQGIPPERVSAELSDMAARDGRALRAAWDVCVARFADGEDQAWLLAATYFISPLLHGVTHDRGGAAWERTRRRRG